MAKKLYVGNLSYDTTEAQVRELFAQAGEIASVNLITDRDTGRAKGFGFVEMSQSDASRAISSVNGQSLEGRALRVNEAICSIVGGTREAVINEETGLLVPPKSSLALAAAILELLSSRGRAERMGRAGGEFCRERVRWDQYVEAINTLYETIASGVRGPA